MRPFDKRERPQGLENAFVEGYLMYMFTNRFGEDWVAYVNYETGDIIVGGDDIDWKWREMPRATTFHNFIPFSMSLGGFSEDETEWLMMVFRMANRCWQQADHRAHPEPPNEKG